MFVIDEAEGAAAAPNKDGKGSQLLRYRVVPVSYSELDIETSLNAAKKQTEVLFDGTSAFLLGYAQITHPRIIFFYSVLQSHKQT